uniref:Secreted protein n=1 Tax=Nothoprocta perdicaria TaxID=30464 RepID=A0A8C7A2F3_NOTPE
MCTTVLLIGTLVVMLRRRFCNKVEPYLAVDGSIKGASVSAKHRSRAGFIWSACGRGELLSAFKDVSCLGEVAGERYFWLRFTTKIWFENKEKYPRFPFADQKPNGSR